MPKGMTPNFLAVPFAFTPCQPLPCPSHTSLSLGSDPPDLHQSYPHSLPIGPWTEEAPQQISLILRMSFFATAANKYIKIFWGDSKMDMTEKQSRSKEEEDQASLGVSKDQGDQSQIEIPAA